MTDDDDKDFPQAMNASADNIRAIRPPAPATGKVLRIVAGLHAGATRALAEQEMLVVGSGDDCDIVLADAGVAAHHALITLVSGVFTLRALDAPLRIEGKPLHPGDPVELQPLQRVDLGEAAIAFGGEDESAWSALFPAIASKPSSPRARPWLRRLPLIAAATVLLIAAVAVVAAFLPRRGSEIDQQAYLNALLRQYSITGGKASVDVNGTPVLSGTVEDAATRARIQQQLQKDGVAATLELRTGNDIANDVREVFRAQGKAVRTRYLGDGAVEIDGDVGSQEELSAVLDSRAMVDIGVRKFVPGGELSGASAVSDAAEKDGAAVVAGPPAEIVSVVRGNNPYVVDANGKQYAPGDQLPGYGALISIGAKIWVYSAAGEVIQVRPVSAAELAARAEAAAAAEQQARAPQAAAQPVVPGAAAQQRRVNEAQAKIPAQNTDGKTAPSSSQR